MKSVHCTLRIGMWLTGWSGVFCSVGSGSLEGASAAGRRDREPSVMSVFEMLCRGRKGHDWGFWFYQVFKVFCRRTTWHKSGGIQVKNGVEMIEKTGHLECPIVRF